MTSAESTLDNSKIRREAILIRGQVRDKLQLIKIASAEAKRRLRADGNITVIKAGDYEPDLDGHICVVEFCSRKPLC